MIFSFMLLASIIVSTTAFDVALKIEDEKGPLLYNLNSTIIKRFYVCLCDDKNKACRIIHQSFVKIVQIGNSDNFSHFENDYLCYFMESNFNCDRFTVDSENPICTAATDRDCLEIALIAHGSSCRIGPVNLFGLRSKTISLQSYTKEISDLFFCAACASSTQDKEEKKENGSNNQESKLVIIIIIVSSICSAAILCIVLTIIILCMKRHKMQRTRTVEIPEAVEVHSTQSRHQEQEKDSVHNYGSVIFSLRDYLAPRNVIKDQELTGDQQITLKESGFDNVAIVDDMNNIEGSNSVTSSEISQDVKDNQDVCRQQ
ncbi:hypothetical protein Bpfe_013326 [Biomphalaria pfeifferi]|uniref:Uncharacterized protein n=1 Tax=Biomphalaria pfeifferi TaxID=112525 RepID=A0AAD8BNB2_BIOPF|nr:hypothetical protein Bpfe_013326 [Biomphalaria pfeifferi]